MKPIPTIDFLSLLQLFTINVIYLISRSYFMSCHANIAEKNCTKASALNELMFFSEFSTARLASKRKWVFESYVDMQLLRKSLMLK